MVPGRQSGPHCSALALGLLSRADHVVPATTRATSSNRPSSGETSRPSLAVPDEQVNLTRALILTQ